MLRTVVNVIIEMMYLFAYNSVAGPRAFLLWVGLAGIIGSLLSAALATVPVYTVILVVLADHCFASMDYPTTAPPQASKKLI
ncbi:hypothetical protein [Ciceribacter sp. T2.26MG-112.2]|uniref:hypothetical protein n=1 Tax=Ciceribacter sp. T2.26MG-112.2 TaxID=3137154 RepID=UPI0012B6A08F|nr:hypothetical protein [Ciceribacter naphthalenivorans]